MYQPTERQLSAFKAVEPNLLLTRKLPISTLKIAFQYAIAKWVAIVNFLRQGILVPRHGGTETCGLCMYYNHRREAFSTLCTTCPIGNFCHNTPYANYNNVSSKTALLKYAKEEVEFLQKLYAKKYG